jgi:hypothetical protein
MKELFLPQINKWQRCTSYDVWKRWWTLTKCSSLLKNDYGLRMLHGYGHVVLILRNKHQGD